MELRLTGIKTSGLRCAELDIELGRGCPARFTFIQMPNGTGKTTIAECLRAALSGEALSWSAEHIGSFRRNAESVSGLFEARFTFDEAPLAVGIRFDFIDERVTYYTAHSRAGGRVPKFSLPGQLARFADVNFVRLYIFDAELPQELLAGGSNRAEGAIDAFYQLYVLDQVSGALQSYWESQVQGASTQQGLKRHQNRLENLRAEQLRLERILEHDKEDLRRVRDALSSKRKQLDAHLNQVEQYRQEKMSLEEARDRAQAQLDGALEAAMNRLRRPLDAHPGFRIALDLVTSGLDSLKLPESTSREFFRDLTEQPTCICGAPMTDDAKAHIDRVAEELLADDAAGIINALKGDVRSFERDKVCPGLSLLADELSDLIRQRDSAKYQLSLLVSDASEKADEAAKHLNDEIEILNGDEKRLSALVDEFSREPWPTDDENGRCIAWFKQEISRLERIVADAAKLVTMREQKDSLRTLLATSAQRAREGARKELVGAMNDRLGVLLPGENIRVVDIRPSLILEGREGVNLGAMLSIGYSFLTTLFERGNHQFPFVVDAPTMGLDGLAREALAEILPRATHQFVGFVLDNERDFARRVRAKEPSECEFYTVFSDSSRNKPLANQVPPGLTPADGGTYVIRGFDFFDRVMWTANGEERNG